MKIDREKYQAELEQQRAERATALLGDRSWLTLAGLYWLTPGKNYFGKAAENTISLPGDALPDQAGVLDFDGEQVTVTATPGVTLTVNGVAVTHQRLADDLDPTPDYLSVGELTMVILRRGARFGVRMWDRSNPARQQFPGLRWYEINPAYRLEATFVPYDPPKALRYANMIGDTVDSTTPGRVCFVWAGEEYFLDAEGRGEGLFFNFRDTTNGAATYGSGRFLYTTGPKDGVVILDFNQATNPYCAYTDYAVCPLPPAQNRLPFAVEAGEMNFPRQNGGVH